MLNPEFVGKAYPESAPYLIGREKVREFATAIGDQNPVFHSVDAARTAGYADLLAPPTFPFVITMQSLSAAMFDPDLGLDYSRVVHGGQRFRYARPLVAGMEVVVRAHIDSIAVAGPHEVMSTFAEVHEIGVPADSSLVVVCESQILSRGTAA